MENAEGFWAPINPAYQEPTDGQLQQLLADLDDVAWRTAERISVRLGRTSGEVPERTRESMRTMPDLQLSRLRVLREIGPAVEELANRAACHAGAVGATYPQLGDAWGISRQAARKRWPGVVGIPAPLEASEFEMAGGSARVSWHSELGGWWWMANAENGEYEESPDDVTYETKEEAGAYAGAFLVSNQLEKGEAK
ncbi:hypothetical protein ACIGZJ_36005 [Kitasatospora sp. NPDC052868]|uniref:hypothetical protein n=1 Tax=Kitasatospora sp. NPDC052868 TaxID=3364060 RepID=UPI0037CBCA3B